MENKYYVYAHFRKGQTNPFYVGKGSGNRLNQTGNRSEFWKRIVAKYGYESKILIDNLSEQDSYKIEIECIAMYKLLGFCEANFSLGGDGINVKKRWWGAKISASTKGIIRPKGLNSKSYKDVISKEKLYQMYVTQNMDSISIGKLTGISYGTICSRLKDFGIEKRGCGKKNIPIICTTDGLRFSSINDAARHYSVFRENIRKVLKGIYSHTKNKHFIYENITNNH